MKSLGQIAYEAYLAHSKGVSLVSGASLPRWEGQKAEIQAAWEAAAHAALIELSKKMRELPKYRSHKIVWALKIAAIMPNGDGSLTVAPAEEGYADFVVPAKFVPKHRDGVPEVGWYWVKYENDYESFSPAKAFEEGYTRI